MTFGEQRTQVKGLLLSAGIEFVSYSKAQSPDILPAGIISLQSREGQNLLACGYADQKYGFEVHLIVDDVETADDELLALIERIDSELQDKYFTAIERVEFYLSVLDTKVVRVARFEVIL